MRWHGTMEVDDLWVGEMVGVEVEGRELFLVNLDGDVRAYKDVCPHEHNPLSDGELEGSTLTCAYHVWTFNCDTGKGINPATSCLYYVPVRVENGWIEIGIPEEEEEPHE